MNIPMSYYNINMGVDSHLRGSSAFKLGDDGNTSPPRGRILDTSAGDNTILLQPVSFQIAMSTVLGIIALAQLVLLASFIHHRSKRVLEFAQPLLICVFVACGMATTCACVLFIYISNVGCAVREPIIFIALSTMGASIAGRAWRISTLLDNPLMDAGNHHSGKMNRTEKARKFILHALTALSGCNFSAWGLIGRSTGGRPIRIQISFGQMMRAMSLLVLPQLLLQIVIVAVPALRGVKQISWSTNYGMEVGRYECKSSVGLWPTYIGIIFTILPYLCAYLLNLRPKSEPDKIPDIIDERYSLEQIFSTFARVAITAIPISVMAISPSVKAYAEIVAVLGVNLPPCYYIAVSKLSILRSNVKQPTSPGVAGSSNDSRHTSAFALKMAEMYQKIGRADETIKLVDETLDMWRKRKNDIISNLVQRESMDEVGSGFTKHDLKSIEAEELELIIQLLGVKGKALMAIHGQAGMSMSAKLNVDALKIFENCPAASKMKDISIIFPVYSLVAVQIKLGVIEQDDEFSLELELAERFNLEAQLQSYHYARSLINLAELYGRKGNYDKAQTCFDVMQSVYLPEEHSKLIAATYNVDRCAVGFATSSLWFMRQGKIDEAIQRCDYVAEQILPSFDQKDVVGLFSVLLPIVLVLRWTDDVNRASDLYEQFTPAGIENHFAVGNLHQPMTMLLKLSKQEQLNDEEMAANVDMALSFTVSDMADNIYTSDCWSMKSLGAELCLCLARQLNPGSSARDNLIDKGIDMATQAKNTTLASNGMVKHVLAYETNSKILTELLLLAKENNAFSRHVVHEGADSTVRRTSALFTERLVIKDCVSTGTANTAASKSAMTAPSAIDLALKKKVNFSQVSSIGSNGSGPPVSKHSNESTQAE